MTALTGGAVALAFVIVCRPEPSVLRAAACGLITLLAIGTGRLQIADPGTGRGRSAAGALRPVAGP